MTIWILFILLLAAGMGLGRTLGAIRVIMGTIGAYVGFIASFPLSGYIAQGLDMVGVKSISLLAVLPPIIVFLAVVIIFFTVAHTIQLKAEFHYRYKVTDEKRVLWERLMQRAGVSLGVLMAVVYTTLICAAVYPATYLTVQVKSPKADSMTQNILNRMNGDMKSTGMEKLAVALDRTPASYYHTADIFGLIYNNPDLRTRLYTYPALMSLVEMPDVIKVLSAQDIEKVFQSKDDFFLFLDHTNVTQLLQNKFIVQQLKKVDPADLHAYLETAKSAKFDSDKMIGIWDLYVPGTLVEVFKMHKIAVNDRIARRPYMVPLLYEVTLTVTPDGNLFLKAPLDNMGILMALLAGNVPNVKPKPPGTLPATLSSGNWRKDGDKFTVVVHNGNTDINGTLEMLSDDSFMIRLPDTAVEFKKAQ